MELRISPNSLLLLSTVVFLMVTCKSQQQLAPTSARQVKPSEVVGYHDPINITIAWYPYDDHKLQRVGLDEWKIVEDPGGDGGAIPVILIRYPDGQDSIWLDMNTSSEVLGKLLKHSLMTQEPITRPFGTYLEEASCTKCHPSDVEVDFNR